MAARTYRQGFRDLPVQRQPPARRPARFTNFECALSCPRIVLSTVARYYLPFSFVASDDGGVVAILSDELPVDDEELVEPDEDDGGVDDVPDGGVVDEDDVLGDVDELEPVLGDVDDEDEDGDGVTTGGVVAPVDVLDSRWQPATPTARPAQSTAINVLVMCLLQKSD